MAYRVLVIDGDPVVRVAIGDILQSQGYAVDLANSGSSGMRRARTATPDLVILDAMLPDCDGLQLLPVLRPLGQLPVIVVTARAGREDKVKGLTRGADDYITKPFDAAEFLARVRAVLRRARPELRRIRLGDVIVDFSERRASSQGRAIALTHREFELLSYLFDHREIVVHRSELLRAVWGFLDTDVVTRTVDFAVARLRRKIERDPHRPQFLRTVHGDGYCLSGFASAAQTEVGSTRTDEPDVDKTGDPHEATQATKRQPATLNT